MSEPTYTLYCGDCLDYMRGMDADSVDAVITDPPYGINHRRGKCANRGKGLTLGSFGIIGDGDPFDPTPFLNFNVVILWGANWYADKLPAGKWIIWDKQVNGGSGDFSEAEIAWCNKGIAIKIFRHMWLGVQRDSEVGESRLHPMQKPVALMEWLIKNHTQIGDTIFDPFMGSGTTGVACMQLGRNFIGCEIDPAYYAIAERRIKDAAAQPALFTLDAPAQKYEQAALMEL